MSLFLWQPSKSLYAAFFWLCGMVVTAQANAHPIAAPTETSPYICCSVVQNNTAVSPLLQHQVGPTLIDFPPHNESASALMFFGEAEETNEKDPERKIWHARGPPRTLYAGIQFNAAVAPYLRITPCQTDRLVMTARAPPTSI